MNWFKRILTGKYGVDQLNIALLILTMVLTFISSVFRIHWLYAISYIPLIFCVFRMFSRYSNSRVQENQTFLRIFTPMGTKIRNEYRVIFGTKTHNYYKCPQCKQVVRVPKGVGKVNVICPKCKNKFTKIS